MLKPSLPLNETQRMRALERYEVLDTSPEELYDNITFLASEICGTPIALISLVDEKRQWFKSRHGLEATEAPREFSFCGHAILQNEIFEIKDARNDRRFSDNPFVTGSPPAIFYAGIPLKSLDHHHIGTLCVIDHKPHSLTDKQKIGLSSLAKQVTALLELRLTAKTTLAALVKLKQSEEAKIKALKLVENERSKFARVFEITPHPIAILSGPSFILSFNNSAFLNHLIGQREILGKTVQDVLPAMVEQGLDFELSHVFQTGETYLAKEINFEVKSKEGDYQKFVMDFVFDAIFDSEGKIEGILLSATDMTEMIAARDAQIQARQLVEVYLGELSFEKSKFEALIEHSSSAIGFMRGADLVFEIANKKWIELVGSREHIGRKYVEIYPELVGSERYNSLVNVFKTGENFTANEMKITVVNLSGILEDMYFDFVNVRIDDAEGKPYGVYCNANDVTDKVRARLELEKAKQEAEKANSTKSTFLANMSHEIRTPLGAIIGYADLLRETALPEFEKKHFVETILRNGKALTRIIDDILDLAKVESGKMELEYLEVNFEELISDVIDLFRERTGSKGISLQAKISPDVPKRLMTDPTRLRQIILNIVGNAVKFTEVGGITIEVIAKKISATENFIEILVKDTGVGLSFDQAQNLFKPFTQADNSTTRKFGGTGLGLALSKRLANALGGDIQIIRSAVDQGCDILITFKVHLSQKIKKDEDFVPEIFEENENTRTLEGFKILIVDDSEDNQMLAQLILQRHGCLVDAASNGREAFRKGIEGNYDLILMDIQMPIMDGYEATRALRDSGFNRPIIALTAHAMAEERARSLASGCSGHLTKPLDQQELIKVILKNLL